MKVYLILLLFLTVISLTFGQSSNTGTTEAPDLNIGIVDTNIELSWDDTHSFDLHVSSNLSDWTNTNVNSSPHSAAVLNVRKFYKLVESVESDTSAPVITINGDSTINLLIGEPYYVEQGATAVDNIDGNVAVNISGVVYTSSPQNSPFTITYTATDAAGNTSTATRIVNIIEPTWYKLGDDIDGESVEDNALVYTGKVSLSSDGTRVAISAPLNDGNGNRSGHVRVYEWSSDAWTQLGDDIDGDPFSKSGDSLSLSSDGTIVAIGAEIANGNSGSSSGHVRVYEWSGDAWTQLGDDIDGEAGGDSSGSSVSLSSDGTRIAIGATHNDDNGHNGHLAGHVRVYEWDNDTWTQLGQDIDGEKRYHFSGASVSLSSDGTRVAIGAPGGFNGFYSSGEVRIFDLINNTWIQTGQVIDGEAVEDGSGRSVSLSSDGTIVAIGASGNDGGGSYSGHVRVYQWTNETWLQGGVTIYGKWTQIGDDIDGEAGGDSSGISVSLSSDGTIVAIGASENNNSGHVRVYEWSGDTWIQLKDDIDGEAVGDKSGSSVSLSGDGTRVAIAAPLNDGDDLSNALNEPGDDYGHVRVYELPEEIKINESDLFLTGGNTSWPYVIPLTRIVDGSSSQLEQKLIINVTELPVGGAYCRIIFIRSGIDGNWIPTPSEPLTLGLNVITVPPDTYNRAIRVQFNNGTVKFNTLAVQEVLSNGYVLTGSVLFPGE
jgi:hypothetical protein